jgi:hypothetical protein
MVQDFSPGRILGNFRIAQEHRLCGSIVSALVGCLLFAIFRAKCTGFLRRNAGLLFAYPSRNTAFLHQFGQASCPGTEKAIELLFENIRTPDTPFQALA